MYPPDVFRGTIERLIAILDRHHIRFHLTGGITSAAFGEPRMTQDIDFVVDPKEIAENLGGMISSLRESGFLFDEKSLRLAVREGSMFQLLDDRESLKLDVYPRELIPGELSRSQAFEIFPGLALPIASRSDIAVSKLLWISKGSHKSRRDFRHIFRSSDTAAQQTIRDLAIQLDLSSLLDIVLAESDELA